MTDSPPVAPALSVRGLTKSFGSNRVLRSVDVDVSPGEIHGLLGENGAGKSTLIKVLAGVCHADDGSIDLGEKTLPRAHSARDASLAGLAFVHQNLGLIDALSVADNIALQVGYTRRGPIIDGGRTLTRANNLLERVGAGFPASLPVGSLSQDEKVLCAIARAFAQDARVIVLDEVSASLPAPEMDRLAAHLIASKADGVAYVFVTHRISEVFSFADRLTVLRDGQVSLSSPVADVTPDDAVRHILGRTLEVEGHHDGRASSEQLFSTRGLCAPGLSAGFDVDIRRGEIVAVCGLVGSGTRSVARLLGGAQAPTSGTATLAGNRLPLGEPAKLAKAGCAYVPGRRQGEGLFPLLTVRENTFPTRSKRSAWNSRGILRPRTERSAVADLSSRYAVKGAPEQAVAELSGGNQQKVVLARILAHEPDLLILEDPTAGVDIGSRAAVHESVRHSTVNGTAVLMISTDFDEVARQADRAIVMREGAIATVLTGPELTVEALASASHGADAPAQAHGSVTP